MQVSKPYFGIQVVDAATGRGVPLIELRLTNDIAYYTDSAGWVAFYEPGLMEREVWFSVKGHGYEHPADGFGYRGARLVPKPGTTAQLKVTRLNIAERLYRLTGAGIYKDSVLLGLKTPSREPLLSGRVMGQDSVMTVRYKDKLYWFWGDTSRPEYPLGHFGTAGATSSLSDSPDRAIHFNYFVDKTGFSRPMFPQDPSKPGPIWVGGVAVIENGQKLICFYSRMKSLGEKLESGLAVFDDTKNQFIPVAQFDPKLPEPLSGHPFLHDGYLIGTRSGADPLPCVRVRPTVAALSDPKSYEIFDGKNWGRDQRLPKWHLKDAVSGAAVKPHGGSVFYNAFRKRWVMIVEENGGKSSNIGEIWYAEAPEFTGPWERAVKIITHDRYDFYNPTQQPFFDKGRYLYFEGTYTNTFSGNPEATPRYNYNQVLYRLDLADTRLKPAH